MVDGTSVGDACSRALKRARCIAADFCSWVISPYSTSTSATPGEAAHLRLDVLADLHPQGTPGGRERDPDHHPAVGIDPDLVDHAEVDDARVQLRVDDPGQHPADVVG